MSTILSTLTLVTIFLIVQKVMIFIITKSLSGKIYKVEVIAFIVEILFFGLFYAMLTLFFVNKMLTIFVENNTFVTVISFIISILFADFLLRHTVPNSLVSFEYNSKNKAFITRLYNFFTTVVVVIITFSLFIKSSMYDVLAFDKMPKLVADLIVGYIVAFSSLVRFRFATELEQWLASYKEQEARKQQSQQKVIFNRICIHNNKRCIHYRKNK